MAAPGRSLYDILNVSQDASQAEIKRAYRRLSGVFHPDKQPSDDLKEEAAQTFAEIKDAYELLVDDEKRRVYDNFGEDGLRAGLDGMATDADMTQLRQQWSDFRSSSYLQEVHMKAAPKSSLELRVSATKPFRELMSGFIPSVWPVIYEASVASEVAVSCSDNLDLHIGSQLKMNPQSRGGEFMVMEGDLRVPASLMYRASDRDTFNVEANLGRQHQVVAVSSQRVLSQRDTGTLALTASPFGVGMQLGCIRQLYDRVRAELNWVLGPAEETGVVLNITRGSDNWSVSGKLQLGSRTVLRAISAYKIQDGTQVIGVANFGTNGIYGECGLRRQWGDLLTTQFTVHHGLMGSLLQIRIIRAGNTIVVPVHISESYQDVQSLLVALLAPPLLNFAISRLVVQPILWLSRRWNRVHGSREAQLRLLQVKERALRQQELIAAAAARMAAQEEAQGGLIIVRAAYGDTSSYIAGLARQAAMFVQQTSHSIQEDAPCPEQLEQEATHPSDAWVEVTKPLQFLVVESQVVLQKRSSRGYLMGFADLNLDGEHELYVMYKYKGSFYEMNVDGTQETFIPSKEATQLHGARKQFAEHLHSD